MTGVFCVSLALLFFMYVSNNNSFTFVCVYFISRTKYTAPELSEGFKEIVKVNFVPKFADKEQKKLYMQFLLEK